MSNDKAMFGQIWDAGQNIDSKKPGLEEFIARGMGTGEWAREGDMQLLPQTVMFLRDLLVKNKVVASQNDARLMDEIYAASMNVNTAREIKLAEEQQREGAQRREPDAEGYTLVDNQGLARRPTLRQGVVGQPVPIVRPRVADALFDTGIVHGADAPQPTVPVVPNPDPHAQMIRDEARDRAQQGRTAGLEQPARPTPVLDPAEEQRQLGELQVPQEEEARRQMDEMRELARRHVAERRAAEQGEGLNADINAEVERALDLAAAERRQGHVTPEFEARELRLQREADNFLREVREVVTDLREPPPQTEEERRNLVEAARVWAHRTWMRAIGLDAIRMEIPVELPNWRNQVRVLRDNLLNERHRLELTGNQIAVTDVGTEPTDGPRQLDAVRERLSRALDGGNRYLTGLRDAINAIARGVNQVRTERQIGELLASVERLGNEALAQVGELEEVYDSITDEQRDDERVDDIAVSLGDVIDEIEMVIDDDLCAVRIDLENLELPEADPERLEPGAGPREVINGANEDDDEFDDDDEDDEEEEELE